MDRPQKKYAGIASLFNFPNISGERFDPGRQPYSPGESQIDSGNPHFSPVPWPNAVQSLVALANHPGIPQGRPVAITNNADAVAPSNWLYIAGFAGKSRG